MFGIGWTEFIVIALVVLVFVGPRNLPPLLRKLGSVMTEFKAASRELRNQIDAEVKDLDISPKKMVRDIEKQVLEEAAGSYEELRRADREIAKNLAGVAREARDAAGVREIGYDPAIVAALPLDTPTEGPAADGDGEIGEVGRGEPGERR